LFTTVHSPAFDLFVFSSSSSLAFVTQKKNTSRFRSGNDGPTYFNWMTSCLWIIRSCWFNELTSHPQRSSW
jgi:hypothetical protein